MLHVRYQSSPQAEWYSSQIGCHVTTLMYPHDLHTAFVLLVVYLILHVLNVSP